MVIVRKRFPRVCFVVTCSRRSVSESDQACERSIRGLAVEVIVPEILGTHPCLHHPLARNILARAAASIRVSLLFDSSRARLNKAWKEGR